MEHVRKHFESEANEFDGIIVKLIPFYPEMIEALVTALPFSGDKSFSALDIGCGTGTVAAKIKERFPSARVDCLDFAAPMIEAAKVKLAKHEGVSYIVGEISSFGFPRNYDAVVSSLALHHLATDRDKQAVYERIYRSLNPGGVFYNADTVLGSNAFLQDAYIAKWKEFMLKSVPEEEIENKWMVTYRTEDRPAKLSDHLKWLAEAGFRDVDVIWKYYQGAVYGGVK